MKRDAKTNRKYRLHVLARRFGRVDSKKRTVFLPASWQYGGSNKAKKVFAELTKIYGYNIQIEIN